MRRCLLALLVFMLVFSPAAYAKVTLEGAQDSLRAESWGLLEYDCPAADGAQKGLLRVCVSQLLRDTGAEAYQRLYFMEIGRAAPGGNRWLTVAPAGAAYFLYPRLEIFSKGRLLAEETLDKTWRMLSYRGFFQLPLARVVENIRQADEVYIELPMTDRARQRIRVPDGLLAQWQKVLNDDNVLFAFVNTRKERLGNGAWGMSREAVEADFAKTWRPLPLNN